MAFVIRLFIGLVVSVLLFLGGLHLAKVAPDRYMPPPMEYLRVTTPGEATVTGTEDRGYGDHFWAGTEEWYFVDFTFQATPLAWDPTGKAVKTVTAGTPPTYNASVRITEDDYRKKYQPGQTIDIYYDPYNPEINGIEGSLGGFSRGLGYWAGYLLYVLGIVALALVLSEVAKKWLPSE
jgi:hypothetical protein